MTVPLLGVAYLRSQVKFPVKSINPSETDHGVSVVFLSIGDHPMTQSNGQFIVNVYIVLS